MLSSLQIEVTIYLVCLALGGPLNVLSLISTVRNYRKNPRYRSQFLLLRMHLNIADSITLFVYTLTQIIWLSTYQVC
ncbi:unnamed protein product [Enterobius vermicularis]|uniref:G_PROTEIN_RECEP_F1_2 domain-containing protein n=1 Tax=Enterobius vermicularis TaxID=51028 RepID=A0A0N4VRU7_ENTVE|nr:unnamed protein product [Enterobius vermicularis]